MFLSFSTFLPRLVSLDGLWFMTIQKPQVYPSKEGGREGGRGGRSREREREREREIF